MQYFSIFFSSRDYFYILNFLGRKGGGRGRHFYINFLLFYNSDIFNNRGSAIHNSFKILFWKFKNGYKADYNETLKICEPQFEKFWIRANNMIWLNISCSNKPSGQSMDENSLNYHFVLPFNSKQYKKWNSYTRKIKISSFPYS